MIGDHVSQTSPDFQRASKDLIKLQRKPSLEITPQALKEADLKLTEVKAKVSPPEFDKLQKMFRDIVSQKWENTLTNADLTSVYHSLGDNAPSTITNVYQNFLDELTPKNVGHLLGDAFLRGTHLEGNPINSSLQFSIDSLKFLLEKHSKNFSPEKIHTIEAAINRLDRAQKISLLLPYLNNEKYSLKELEAKHQQCMQKIQEDLNSLKAGESCLIPWGWATKGGSGHAMMMEYCPSSGILKVFNTGDGTQLHDYDPDQKLYVNTVKTYRLTPSEFNERLPVLLESKFLPRGKDRLNLIKEFEAKELYSKLKSYEISSKEIPEVWQKGQLSGTCSLRCILAYLASLEGLNNKELKHLWEKEVVRGLLENTDILNPEISKMLSVAIPNLFSYSVKSGNRKDLPELERLKALYEAKVGEEISVNVPPSDVIEAKPLPIEKPADVSRAQSVINKSNVENVSNYPLKPLQECKSLSELKHHLQLVSEFCKKNPENNRQYLQEALCQLGKLGFNPANTERKTHIMNEIKVHPAEAEDLIKSIKDICESLLNSPQKDRSDMKQLLAYQSAMLFTFNIAQAQDPFLEDYGLNSKLFLLLKDCKIGRPTFLNVELEEDYQHLLEASLELQKKARRLNSYESVKDDYSGKFCIPAESGDYLYAEKLVKQKNPDYWVNVDNAYQIDKSLNPSTKATLDEYRIYHQYLEDLPPAIFLLRLISFFAAKDLDSDRQPVQEVQKYMDFYGPVLKSRICMDSYMSNAIENPTFKSNFPHLEKVNVNFDDQNTTIAMTRSEYYGNHIKHNLHMTAILDQFISSMEDIRSAECQAFISSILFHPLRLKDALQQNPNLEKDLAKFFDESLNYYMLKAAASMKKEDRVQTVAFLMEQKARTLTFLEKLKGKQIEQDLKELRKQVNGLMTHPDYQSSEMQHYLALCFIQSFGCKKELNKKDASDLLLACIHAKIQGKSSDLPSELYTSSTHIMFTHFDSFRKFTDEDWKQLLISAGKNSKIDILDMKINSSKFPFIEAHLPGDNTLVLDCISGKLTLNGKTLQFNSDTLYESTAYAIVFGDVKLPQRKLIDGIELEDPISKIIYNEVDSSFTRLYRGETYQFSKEKPKYLDYLPNPNQYQLWISADPKANPQILVIDRRKQNVAYTITDGRFTLGADGSQYELLDSRQQILFKNLDNKALLWKPINAKDQMLVQLPSALDESEAQMQFVFDQNKWIWKAHPQWYVARDQTVKNITLKEPYIVLEKENGEKELILIDEVTGRINRLTIKNGELAPQSNAYKNMSCAYLYLINSKSAKDYEKAVEYLHRSKEYRRYNAEELKLQGFIVTSLSENSDHFPDACAVRLYALSLVYDNFERFPELDEKKSPEQNQNEKETLTKQSPPEKWEKFWINLVLKDGDLRNEIISNYSTRENNIQKKLRIEQLVPITNLKRWGLGVNKTRKSLEDSIQWKAITESEYNLFVVPKKQIKSLPYFRTRLDKNQLSSHFEFMKTLAESSNPKDRQIIKNFLDDTIFEQDPQNQIALLMIWIVFLEHEQDFSDKNLARLNFEAHNCYSYLFFRNQMSSAARARPAIEDFRDDFNRYIKSRLNEGVQQSRPNKKIPDITSIKPVSDHKTPPIKQLNYSAQPDLFGNLNESFDRFFSWPKDVDKVKPPRLFQATPGVNAARIDALNKEYITGFRKNYRDKNIELKGTSETIRNSLLKELLPQIKESVTLDKRISEQYRQQILKIANQDVRLDEKARVELGRGLREPLTMDDCLILFMQGDRQAFAEKTLIKSPEVIEELFMKIGIYLEKTIRLRVNSELKNKLTALESDPNPSLETLQEIARTLATSHPLETCVNPAAVLVFEYKLNLLLRDHQLEGLNDLSQLKSLIVQRIQAGGKTLIWGHLLALIKADGYHLSVHVSPTHQYASNLYDMGDRSKYAFDQIQNTLIFDDHPAYFTHEYLDQMQETLARAIANREYIHTTSDTLRAMRCKYIKTALKINFEPYLKPQELAELKKVNDKLKEILALFRLRAIFTFDEVHQAMDPLKELNMPYGVVTHPDLKQSALIHTIVRLASTAKDKDGKSIARLRENQSANMSSKQKLELKFAVADAFIKDPVWRESLGISSETEIDMFRIYLTSEKADFPSALEKKGNEQKQLMILARQMLAGNWLEEALSKSVHEHYGVVYQKNLPPIAIPFLANMTPALGSEFSDIHVMMTNTFISYIVQGVNQTQAKEFIDYLHVRLLQEWEALKETNSTAKLQDVPIYKDFINLSKSLGYDLDLTTFDRNNTDQLAMIQKMLSQESDLSHRMLLEFIATKVISKVELHKNQVTTNGRGTATMAKITDGYSATVDNLHMAPVMDSNGTRVEIKQDYGTNGQTIDLLLRNFTSVWVINTAPESLFTDLITKLPDDKRNRVRAIIDEGCHFRGVPNQQVAKMICEKLTNPQIKVILFFDNQTGKLCYMRKDDPSYVRELKGTTQEVIAEETECKLHELFAYFDQDHCTGTNIALSGDGIAISTLTADNVLHDKLQGDRRMRQLDLHQEIITAVGSESLDRIASLLKKQEIRNLTTGSQIESSELIQDIVLYLYLNEWKREEKLTLAYCLQDMENVVHQYLLDQIYSGKLKEEDVFKKVGSLFVKDIFVDLYQQYAKQKKEIPIAEYLNAVAKQLMSKLSAMSLPWGEAGRLEKQLNLIINSVKADVQPKIEVSPDFAKKAAANRERDTTNVQTRQADRKSDKDEDRESDRKNVAKGLRELKQRVFEEPFKYSQLGLADIPILAVRDRNKFVVRKKDLISEIIALIITSDSPNKEKHITFLKNPDRLNLNKLDLIFARNGLLKGEESAEEIIDTLITRSEFKKSYYCVDEAEELNNQIDAILFDNQVGELFNDDVQFNSIKNSITQLREEQTHDKPKFIYEKDLLPIYEKLLSLVRTRIPTYEPPYLPPLMNVYFALNDVVAIERKEMSGLFDPGLIATANFIRTAMTDFSNLYDEYRKPVQEVLVICETNPKTKAQKWKTLLISMAEAEQLALHMKDIKIPSNRRMWLMRPQNEEAWPGPFPFDEKEIRANPQVMLQLTQALFHTGNVHFLAKAPWTGILKKWVGSMSSKDKKALKHLFENDILRGNAIEKYMASPLAKMWES